MPVVFQNLLTHNLWHHWAARRADLHAAFQHRLGLAQQPRQIAGVQYDGLARPAPGLSPMAALRAFRYDPRGPHANVTVDQLQESICKVYIKFVVDVLLICQYIRL